MYDPLDELKQMPSIPSLSDKEKKKESDKENAEINEKFKGKTGSANDSYMDGFNMIKYNKENTDKKLLEAKKLENLDTQLLNGEITEEEYNNILNKLGEQEIEEKKQVVQGNIYTPTIDLLVLNGLISQADSTKLTDYIYDNINTHTDNNKSIDIQKIEGLENPNVIKEHFQKVENADKMGNENENLQNFKKDFPDYFNESNKFEGLEEAIFSIIGRNYLKIEGGNIPENESKEALLLAAINTSANKINSLPNALSSNARGSQTFVNAMKNIQSGNIQKAIDGFTSLYSLVFSNIGKKGSAMDKGKKMLGKTLKNRLDNIAKNIEMIEHQIDLGNNNTDKRKDLEKKLEELTLEQVEIQQGDIFTATEIDVQSEGNESGGENI